LNDDIKNTIITDITKSRYLREKILDDPDYFPDEIKKNNFTLHVIPVGRDDGIMNSGYTIGVYAKASEISQPTGGKKSRRKARKNKRTKKNKKTYRKNYFFCKTI
jgi:hypothetical protein